MTASVVFISVSPSRMGSYVRRMVRMPSTAMAIRRRTVPAEYPVGALALRGCAAGITFGAMVPGEEKPATSATAADGMTGSPATVQRACMIRGVPVAHGDSTETVFSRVNLKPSRPVTFRKLSAGCRTHKPSDTLTRLSRRNQDGVRAKYANLTWWPVRLVLLLPPRSTAGSYRGMTSSGRPSIRRPSGSTSVAAR